MIAIDLSKQQELDADPRAIQQINFTANLDAGNTMFFIIEQVQETVFEFSQWTVKVLWMQFFWIRFRWIILILIIIKITQYNSLNVRLSNSQLNKIKSAIKNETDVVLRLSLNMIGDNETNFCHKLLLTNRHVSNLRQAFSLIFVISYY